LEEQLLDDCVNPIQMKSFCVKKTGLGGGGGDLANWEKKKID